MEAITKSELGRREMMVRVLQSVGTLSVGSLATAGQHVHPILPAENQVAVTANWAPKFLNARQNATMMALNERIIPGSKEALCHRVIDSVLAIESEKNKAETVQALAAFDVEAKRLHGMTFHELTAEQQDELLNAAASTGGKLHAEFSLAKEWTADAYWSSLKGLRELGWTGRMAWDGVPDCRDIEKKQ